MGNHLGPFSGASSQTEGHFKERSYKFGSEHARDLILVSNPGFLCEKFGQNQKIKLNYNCTIIHGYPR